MLSYQGYKSLFENNSFNHLEADFVSDFNRLNDMLFDGKLISVKIKLINTKRIAGEIRFVNGEISYIGISSFYKFTKEQYLSILAHEMIHTYIHQMGLRDSDSHGRVFLRMVDELNNKQNEFNISKTENISDVIVKSEDEKEIGAILFTFNKDDYGVVFINSKLINDKNELDKFCDLLKKYMEYPLNVFRKDTSVQLDFYKCFNSDLSKFKIKRILNLKSLEIEKVDSNIINKIKEGEKITSCKLK